VIRGSSRWVALTTFTLLSRVEKFGGFVDRIRVHFKWGVSNVNLGRCPVHTNVEWYRTTVCSLKKRVYVRSTLVVRRYDCDARVLLCKLLPNLDRRASTSLTPCGVRSDRRSSTTAAAATDHIDCGRRTCTRHGEVNALEVTYSVPIALSTNVRVSHSDVLTRALIRRELRTGIAPPFGFSQASYHGKYSARTQSVTTVEKPENYYTTLTVE